MAFQDLLLVTRAGTEAGTRYALWLAKLCGAKLTAASPLAEPALPLFIKQDIPTDILSRMREDAENAARKSLDFFSESAKQTDVAVETLRLEVPSGDIGGAVSRLARYFDATILQQPDPEGADTAEIIEAVLFGSGRPVLIVPYVDVPPHLGTVVVAWDEGRPAARAVADALPLLTMADRVNVVSVNKDGEESSLPSKDMSRHLARHGIKAEGVGLPGSGGGVANTLLSYAADLDAGLIVMGGYGHSRLREMVLGGTTRTILKSMTVPVLMAH
jgi:nucleotide-binding universal stress UspA family protein